MVCCPVSRNFGTGVKCGERNTKDSKANIPGQFGGDCQELFLGEGIPGKNIPGEYLCHDIRGQLSGDCQETFTGGNVSGKIPPQSIQESDASESESREENNGVVPLCVDRQVNDIKGRFLIDNGTSECLISETLVEDQALSLCKSQEKRNIHLGDRSLRSSNQCLSQAYVNFGEHARFWDFDAMK